MTQSRWPHGFLNRVLRRQPPADLVPKGRNIPLRLGAKDPLVDERRNGPYISNAIRTTRYTLWDFLPRQLVYQLSRLAHAYLMTVAILQVIPGLSTTGKFTQVIPLTIFILLIMGKEAYYDWKRYRADVAENSRPASVLQDAGSGPGGLDWITKPWGDISVGDVIKLSRNEDVPADIVLLYASGENGLAYVDTMALDGETNLKPKQSPANIPNCSTIQSITECHAEFVIEQPNADLYRFDSTVTVNGITLSMKTEDVLYRGSTVRNTTTVIGMVVNTGEECKIRMNSKQTMKPKRPALETMTNNIVICLALYVLIISIVLTGGYFSWQSSAESKAWYLAGSSVPFQEIFFGFIIMFNQVIPLSLYVGLEATKLLQASLVMSDLSIYHEPSDTPAEVNNTNNLDDLGQISYVFTDKTGTLTENIMNLRRLSVAGISWLHLADLGEADASVFQSSGAGFTTDDMRNHMRAEPTSPSTNRATRFLLAMALCHTCLPETDAEGRIQYEGSSPDEVALARAAKDMGFVVTQRSSQSITVQTPGRNGSATTEVYRVLDVIEFSSQRKRMTIIVKCPDGSLWLICKGADSILLPRLVRNPSDLAHRQAASSFSPGMADGHRQGINGASYSPTRSSTYSAGSDGNNLGYADEYGSEDGMLLQAQQASRTGPSEPIDSFAPRSDEDDIQQCYKHVDDFAAEGLRTLIYADKVLTAEEYEEWKKLFVEAETSLTQRQERIEEVGEMIEQSLHLLGASAVEDKLQEGVPETILKLRRANIKICMLTGDKRETAINIAHSTQICGPESSMSILDVDEGDLELQLRNAMKRIEAADQDTDCSGTTTAVHTALVVDGKTLGEIEKGSSAEIRQLFYALVPAVDSVICCRASPAQKALLITIVGDGPPPEAKPSFLSACLGWFKRPKKPLTLAIGDGANDVAMIMTASVGVGISGREGQQAARVADLSISQFRYLGRLMLVHGRYSYHRTAIFILTTFWKEMFVFLPQGLFQGDTGVTGTSLYQSTSLIFVSFLTGASMVVIGTWEKDLSPGTLMAIPELYTYGQKREALKMSIFLGWMGNAVIAGSVAFNGPWLGYAKTELVKDNGLFAQGTMTFIVCIIWINYKILILEMHHKTKIAIWSAVGSVAGLWVYQLINAASAAPSSTPYSAKNGLTTGFGRDAAWWMTLIWTLGALLLIELTLRSFKQNSMIRSAIYRCWPFEKKTAIGGGVRNGFRDWELRLWQEMETDPAVAKILKRLS
ncbi:Putative P-type ATPase, subfamily IV, P-type ATPase, A domain superfamily, HAD superfamily [Colletotrichum destructivum]|uniref:Phospholipid-transporting ATPase n=1 Tax=Colletotrichum destructivum TaxID=34406 RepID=A0AAX4I2Q2_9PEZI|nr:Putative P-type ATPase, subfamily IV, P-type ATPase, A domain superfamily, HAD superfamily [Colletotrichum destructivum]